MAEIIDQQNTSGTIGIGFGDVGNGRDYMAQGFIPTLDNITAIAFYLVGKSGNSNQGYRVWIDTADTDYFPENGVGGIGGSTLITNAELTTGALTKYSLDSSVSLTIGNRYVFVIAPWNTSTNAYSSDYQDFRSSVSNPYANGRRVHGNTAYDSWSAPDSGNADLLFRTYGEDAPADLEVSVSDSITVSEDGATRPEIKVSVTDYVSASDTRTNLIANPSFETNTNGWNLDTPFTRITSDADNGSASIQFVGNDEFDNLFTPEFPYNTTTVLPNKTYTLRFRYKVTAYSSGNLPHVVLADGANPFEWTGINNSYVDLSNNSSWTTESITVNTGTATSLFVRISGNEANSNTTVLFDSFTLQLGTATDYFEGTIANNVQAELNSFVSVSDSITTTENTALTVTDLPLVASDSITISESVKVESELHVRASDTITVSENLEASVSPTSLSIEDSIEVTESVAVELPINTIAEDTVTVIEAVTVALQAPEYLFIEVSDTVSTTDTVSLNLTSFVAVSDEITITENTSLDIPLEVQVSDEITVSDTAIIPPILLTLSVQDTVSVTDTAQQFTYPLFIQVSDNVTVSDQPNIFIELVAFLISVSDNVSISESFYVYPPHTPDPPPTMVFIEGRLAYLVIKAGIPQYILLD